MTSVLKTIVGDANFSDRNLEAFSYRSDASRMSGIVDAVVWPTTAEQVQKVVVAAKRLGILLQLRGAGTSLSGGAVPRKAVVVDMSRLNRIRECSESHVIAEAGVVVGRLNRWLAAKGKFFPIMPESHHACTIGGMAATNASSGNRYGRMSDWVEAVEVVYGTGIKDWLPKDKAERVIGKEGITGIVTAAKLKVISIPPRGSMDILRFSTTVAMSEAAAKLRGRSDVIDVTYLDETCSSLLGLEPFIHLLVHYSTIEGRLSSDEEVLHMLAKREALPSLLKSSGYIIADDPLLPEQSAARFAYELRKSNTPTYAHILTGVFHPCFRDNDPKREEVKRLVKRLGGSTVGEYGYGSLRRSELKEDEATKLKAMKAEYDPENVLNPGKVL